MHTTFKLVAFVCLSITAFMLCTGCFEMTQELIPNKHRSVHYVVAPSSTPASFRSRQAAPAFTLAALERKIAPLSDFKDKVVEVEVALISTDADTGTLIILLKEKEGNPKYMLPIWIGQPEALAIQWKLQGKAPPRPMTHDLMKNIIEHLNATVDAVYVHTIEDSTYFGRINLKSNGKTLEIDARSSDAIALALRFEAPIYVAEQVIQKTGFPETELNTAEERQPEESRQHIPSAPTAPPLGRPPELLVGRPAPAFTLTDLEGKLVSLSDFKKKAILLDFWATWCPPCVKEIPHFITLYEQYKDQGFEVVGISVD